METCRIERELVRYTFPPGRVVVVEGLQGMGYQIGEERYAERSR